MNFYRVGLLVLIAFPLARSAPAPDLPPPNTSAENEKQAAQTNPFIDAQHARFADNPQWFLAPGRPCNPEMAAEDLYILNVSC